jgi:hypothetical protein
MVRVMGLLAVALLVASASASAAASPSAIRSAIVAAAQAQGSAHYVAANRGTGWRETLVSDVAVDRGIQRVTFVQNGSTGKLIVLVLRSATFIRGNAFGLRATAAFPSSKASRYAERWVSIPRTSPAFAVFSNGVTLGSFLKSFVPQHHLTIVHTSLAGAKVLVLHGIGPDLGVAVVDTLYVPARGSPLPFKERTLVRGRYGGTGKLSISHWNEHLSIQAPANAVSLSTAVPNWH